MCSRFHSTFEFQIVCTFKLGFSRDRTSPCPFVLGQKSFLFPLSFCPGTKRNPCSSVLLSRDKGRIKNPGTNSSVLGQNQYLIVKKKVKKSRNFAKKRLFFLNFELLSLFFSSVQCREVRLASFLTCGFTTMAVMYPPESKLAKRTSVQCSVPVRDRLSKSNYDGFLVSLF